MVINTLLTIKTKKMFKKEFLTEEEKATITSWVTTAEKRTAGEIKVVIVPHSEGYPSVRAHAEEAFQKYGLYKTKDKTGFLLFLSHKEHSIEILADEGINAKIEQGVWNVMVSNLAKDIQSGNICMGICGIVEQAGILLTQHFPIQEGDINELSNEVVVE